SDDGVGFGVTNMSVPFLLTIRLIVAGVLLLSFSLLAKKDIFAVWKSFPSAMQLILFSIIGVLGLQYAFLGAIDASNSVVATLFPIFSTNYCCIIYFIKNERITAAKSSYWDYWNINWFIFIINQRHFG
ncbi:hypothetical protein ACT7CZ_31755, partial [Bacillus cereus]